MILTGNPLNPSLGSHFSTCSTKQTGTMCSECFSPFISQIVLCFASSMLLVLFYFHGKTEADRRHQDLRIISELITKICSDVRSGLHEFMAARHPENFCRVRVFPRISGTLDSEFMNLIERRWLEIYRSPKRIFLQLVDSMHPLGRNTTRM